ncbi:MAG: response regulator [Thiotrichaceae bacterium]
MATIREPHQYAISGWSLDIASNTITKGEKSVILPPRQIDLLHFFAIRAGQVLSRDELAFGIWGRTVSDHAITQTVCQVRKFLAPNDLSTVPKRGYRLSRKCVQSTQTPDREPDKNTQKILIVEDHPYVRQCIVKIVKTIAGCEPTATSSAELAQIYLNNEEFDALITDISLGEMNGLELIKQVRTGSLNTQTNLPIIVVTSFNQSNIRGTALLLDVDGFIAKPISGQLLIKTLLYSRNRKLDVKSHIAYELINTSFGLLRPIALDRVKVIDKEA